MKPLPCPFCGAPVYVKDFTEHHHYCTCNNLNRLCHYQSGTFETIAEAIFAHNRVAKAVMDAKAKEEAK